MIFLHYVHVTVHAEEQRKICKKLEMQALVISDQGSVFEQTLDLFLSGDESTMGEKNGYWYCFLQVRTNSLLQWVIC